MLDNFQSSINHEQRLIEHAQIPFELRPGEGEVIVSQLINDSNMGWFAPQSGRNAGKQTVQLNFLHFKELRMKISLINTESTEPSVGASRAAAQQVELSHRLLLSSTQPKANTSFPGGMGSEHKSRTGAVCVQRGAVKMGRQSTGAHCWGLGAPSQLSHAVGAMRAKQHVLGQRGGHSALHSQRVGDFCLCQGMVDQQ